MNRLIETYDCYSIGQLSADRLHELAEFVVRENYRHHTKSPGSDFRRDVERIYHEEMSYFKRSQIFIATEANGKIIGSIRVMNWDRQQQLPLQTLFNIPTLTRLLAEQTSAVWHIGRLAVSTGISSCRLTLFKILLLYAMLPIYESENDLVLAECDHKLLRIMRLMGICVQQLGEGIEYLGSQTIPIYATRDGLVDFFYKNQSLMRPCTTVSA